MKFNAASFICCLTFSLFSGILHAGYVQVNNPGFGSISNSGCSALCTFNGSIYAGTYNWQVGAGLYRSPDGIHWTNIPGTIRGFGNQTNYEVCSLAVFRGFIYAGTVNNSGCEGWRSSGGIWTKAIASGFGSPVNTEVLFYSNNGFLYGGTAANGAEGSRIYRSPTGIPGSWSLIVPSSNGFGIVNNRMISSFAFFKGNMFAGIQNFSGSEIYMSSNGTTWQRITSCTMGWHSAGFPKPQAVLTLCVFNSMLYAGCDDGSIYRSPDGTNWLRVQNSSGFGFQSINNLVVRSNRIYAASRSLTGYGMLYSSDTGDPGSWQILNQDGWADQNNQQNRCMTVFLNGLFIGNDNWVEGCAVYSDLVFDRVDAVLTGLSSPFFSSAAQPNNPVMAFQFSDPYGHKLSFVRIRNSGNAVASTDISSLKLWYDVNGNSLWDSGDILIASNSIATNGAWSFGGLAIRSGTNILVTADIANTARTNRSFNAYSFGNINKGDMVCSAGGFLVQTVSSPYPMVIGPYKSGVKINTNVQTKTVGYVSWPGTNIFSFKIYNTAGFSITRLAVGNLGTMSNADISAIELYYDVRTNGKYNPGDVYAAYLSWSPVDKKWVFQSGSPWPQPLPSNTNYLLLVQTSQAGKVSNTFRPVIGPGDIVFSDGTYNSGIVSNANSLVRIDEVVPVKLSDASKTNANAGTTNVTVLNFQTKDWDVDPIISLSIRNQGTAINRLDITNIRLWRDIFVNGRWTPGDVLIATASFNTNTGYYDFTTLNVPNLTRLLVTVSLPVLTARSNRTFQAVIDPGKLICSRGVANNVSITNLNPVVIKNSNEFAVLRTNTLVTGPVYLVTSNYKNREILDFTYYNTKSTRSLQTLGIANLSNMAAGADVSAVHVWRDLGTRGHFDAGTDISLGDLVWDGIGKWTNNNLSIPEGSDVLITIDTTPGINPASKFRACVPNVTDARTSSGMPVLNTITNFKTLAVFLIPPLAVTNIVPFVFNNSILLGWKMVLSPILAGYVVAYDTASHALFSQYPFSTNVSGNSAYLSGLNPNHDWYIRVYALDWAGNMSSSIIEVKAHTIQQFVPNFSEVISDGFGSIQNRQISSLAAYSNALYCGVEGNGGPFSGASLRSSQSGGSWQTVASNGFGNSAYMDIPALAVFNNRLYAGVSRIFGGSGCSIYRNTPGGQWQAVVDGGVGDTLHFGVRAMAVFNGKLYAGTESTTVGTAIWMTTDGSNWSKVNTEGFGDLNNHRTLSMSVFKNRLYVGVENTVMGGEIWSTSDGSTWQMASASTNGFMNLANTGIAAMGVFRDQLVATTANNTFGCEVWKSKNGTNWVCVAKNGFGNSIFNSADSLAVRSNSLYCGTASFSSCNLWKTSNLSNWQSALPSSFGDALNQSVASAVVFRSNLYFGTLNNSTGAQMWSDLSSSLSVTKLTDFPSSMVAAGSVKNSVLSFRITDPSGSTIKILRVKNLGTMNTVDVAGLKLWIDVAGTKIWQPSDVSCGPAAVWDPATQSWSFYYLDVPTNMDLIVTVDLAANALPGRTFVPYIGTNDMVSSMNSRNGNSITNLGAFTVDTVPPSGIAVLPAPGAVYVATNTLVILKAIDNIGVVSQSILMRLNGTNILVNGKFQPGWTGLFKATNNGWIVSVDKLTPFKEWTTFTAQGHFSDASGNTNGLMWNFTTDDTTSPTRVVLSGPGTNSWNKSMPVFSWHPAIDNASGISNYIVELSSNAFFFPLNTVATLANTNWQRPLPISDGIWYWRVRAMDRRANAGLFSVVWKLQIDSTPPTIGTPNPPDGASISSLALTFSWSSVDATSGISNFIIHIDTNNNLIGYEIIKSTNQAVFPFVFGRNSTNHWYVTAFDRVGNSNVSPIWTLIIRTNAPQAILYSPVNIYTTNFRPTFVWNQLFSADTNILQTSTNGFTSILSSDPTTMTQLVPSSSMREGTNWWRVLSRKISNSTWYTSYRASFIMDHTAPSVPVQSLPASNSYINFNPVFRWGKSVDPGTGYMPSGLSNYVLQIASNASFSPVNTTLSLTVTNYSRFPQLPDGTWYWRVRAIDRIGNSSAYGPVWPFLIDRVPPVFSNLSPASNQLIHSRLAVFSWSASDASSGLLDVFFQIDTNNDFIADFTTNMPGTTTSISRLLRDDSTNHWRIFIRDRAGNFRLSSWFKLTVLSNRPIPHIYTPVTGSIITNIRTVSFIWSFATSLSNVLQVSSNSSFSSFFISTNLGTATNYFNPAKPFPDKTWVFRILTFQPGNSFSTATNIFTMSFKSNFVVVKGPISDNLDSARIYPNPLFLNENLRIDRLTLQAKIAVYSLNGIKLWEKSVDGYDGSIIAEWNNPDIASGVYIVVLTNNKGQKSVRKLVYIRDFRR